MMDGEEASMFRVVISQSLPPMAVDSLRALLGEGFEVIEAGGRPEAELLAALETASAMIGQTFTPAMGRAGAGLKLVQAQGAGTDGIERAALPPGCYVANCYEHDISIAEFILGMALAVTRDIVRFDRNLRARGDFSPSGFYGGIPRRELRGRSMGIVGYGRIGRETARLARAFGMTVLATKATPDPALAERDGLAWLGGADQLDELLARSDYVVVCVPLTEATRGLIGAAQFARMKPDAYLINIARGPVVDEAALYAALRDQRIAGAAIDVWYHYPPTGQGRPGHFPFEELDNLVMTPHVAGWTEGTVSRRVEVMADNIRRVAAGEPPRNLVAVGK
jgi:phosphoglycerate dehydrogenase-like enzyme